MAAIEFQCMIQDILGNEIYHKSSTDKLADRTIFYCITIPGENEWVRAGQKQQSAKFESERSLELTHIFPTPSLEDTRAPESEETDRLSHSLVNWSFPIPSDAKNRSCLIKVYDNDLVEHLRVNDIVKVEGIVEPDEAASDPNSTSADNNNSNDKNNGTNARYVDDVFEQDRDFAPASDFSYRLVPRVHVKALKKLNHINPLLPDVILRNKIDLTKLKLARARLSTILTQLLGGDSLAAEYLILSLISHTHRRKDATTLGQFTIGFSGVTSEMKFLIDKIYEILTRITTHSHFIDLSIANLNNLRFTPQKDHDNNKMIAGTLQLPDGLYLVLNETALTEGQLTAQGTENLSTLNQIIRWQRLNYNFKFHSVAIDTDLKILVISEGKSLLSVPYHVKLDKTDSETIKSMKQACDAVDDFLTEDLLDMLRYFITVLKDVPEYNISDEVQKGIQEDFCNWRKSDLADGKTLFSADDLSSHMNVARYLTLSRGETSLTIDLNLNILVMREHLKDYFPQRFPDSELGLYRKVERLFNSVKADQMTTKCEMNVMSVVENSDEIRLMVGAMKKHGCHFDLARHISCEMCGSNCRGGYDPDTNQIIICQNNITQRNKIMEVLMHEMIHMFDYCRAQFDFNNLEHVACSEIRAANLTSCSVLDRIRFSSPESYFKRTHEFCVKGAAFKSVKAYSPDTDSDKIMDIIHKVFPGCYNDLEPFGRRPSKNSLGFKQSYRERFHYGYVY